MAEESTMSQGIPSEPGPSHWEYMAGEMARILRETALKSCLTKGNVPAGILTDAVRFSRLVLIGHSTIHFNPPAQAALLLAKEAMERIMGYYPSGDDFRPVLLGCRLIVRLAESGQLKNRETLSVRNISQFFSELSRMGEEERSARFGRDDLRTGDDE